MKRRNFVEILLPQLFAPHYGRKNFKNKEVPASKHIRLRSLYTTRQLLLDLLLYNKKPYN